MWWFGGGESLKKEMKCYVSSEECGEVAVYVMKSDGGMCVLNIVMIISGVSV